MCQQENYTVLRKRRCEIHESKGAKPFLNVCPYERKVKADDLLGSELAWCESQFTASLLLGMAGSFVNGTKQIPASRAEHVALLIAVNADPPN